MNTFEAIKTMLAVRDYDNQPIPPETVSRIIQAGQLTGSSMNRQEWDFIIIQDKQTLQQLGQLTSTGGYIARAPLAVAVVVADWPWGQIDGARAAQDMMLVAWEEGIGSNWVAHTNTDDIKDLLQVPRERVVLTVIPFGYPAQKVGQGHKKRKPLAEIAHAEKFGRPYQG